MRFSRDDVERALDDAGVPEGVALRVVSPEILAALDERHRRIVRFWDEADRREDREQEDERERELRAVTRSTILTYAFVSEIQQGEVFVDAVPGAALGWDMRDELRVFGAVGLIQSRGVGRLPTFGVSVQLPRDVDDRFRSLERWSRERPSSVYFPRLGARLPLAVVSVEQELHAAPNLIGATTTCYALRGGVPGIVVAGHSVAHSLRGDLMDLDDGSRGYLAHSGYQPIDAAFVEISHLPPRLTDLPVVEFPTMGDEVIVQTRNGEQHRKVALVGIAIVSPSFSEYPLVLYLDGGCSPGDSGSLIRLARTGEAVGIYTGTHRLRDPIAAELLGTAQNMAQAVHALGVQPKR